MKRKLLACLAALLLLSACAAESTARPTGTAPSTVVFLGDSIAEGEALPLGAAMHASGVGFQSIASDGGGNVVGPFSDKNWEKLPGQLTSAKPSVVVYQLTTYDWGSQAEQQAAYARLLATVTSAGAKLVFVTAPPIKPDDFYAPHMPELAHAADAARAVTANSAGQAGFLDASAVWGNEYQQTKDGKPDRSADGIHACPQGAARFTQWLLKELASLFPGFTPASAKDWANTGWSADMHFTGC